MNNWIDNNMNQFRSYMLGLVLGFALGFSIAMGFFA